MDSDRIQLEYFPCPVTRLNVHLDAVAAARHRKTAKAKVRLYQQGKLPHDKLPVVAKILLRRKDVGSQEIGIKKGAWLKLNGL